MMAEMIMDIAQRKDVIRIYEGGVTPTLNSFMGTGGNNIPLVLVNGENLLRRNTVLPMETGHKERDAAE